MLQFVTRLFAVLLLATQVSIPLAANDVLQRIPDNALGFALVRDLAQANTKFDQLTQPLGVTFPSPLTFAKVVTGLEAGIDLSGNLLIALLPRSTSQGNFEPMVLLPITSYQEFAASINADTSGEICRVTLLGEDILVAQNGPYAVLMNVEHQQKMHELVALRAEPVAALSQSQAWLAKQDVALVLMPSGVEQVSNWKRRPTRRFGGGSPFGQSRSMLTEMSSGILGPASRDWFRSNVLLTAIGVAVDDQSNVRVSEQLILKANSRFTRLDSKAITRRAAKLGLSQQPFVFTAGGTIRPSWGKQLATFWRQVEQSQVAETGLEQVSAELWDKEEQAFRLLFEDIRACSVMMMPGEQGEPLLGNFLGVATVPDVSEYLRSLPTVVATWNEITQLSTSDIKLEVELNPLTLIGARGEEKRGYEFVVDIASQARDPNVPALNWMVESALGPEGKLRVQLVGVDQKTFVFSMATPKQLAELLRVAPQEESNNPQAPAAKATLTLLQPAADWKMLISPQGCLRWASRIANELLSPLDSHEFEFPEVPVTPPVGITVSWTDRQWASELVCPAEAWKSLGNLLEGFRNP